MIMLKFITEILIIFLCLSAYLMIIDIKYDMKMMDAKLTDLVVVRSSN